MDFFSETTKKSASFTETLIIEGNGFDSTENPLLIQGVVDLSDNSEKTPEIKRIDINLKKFKLSDLLRKLVEEGGDELHLKPGYTPAFLIQGNMVFAANHYLTSGKIETLLSCLLTKSKRKSLDDNGNLDVAYEIPDLAKFHVNILSQPHGLIAVFKVISAQLLTEMNLPTVRKKLASTIIEI